MKYTSNAYEMHAHEVYPHEMHAYEVHAHEVYPHEMHAHEMHAHKTHAYEIHALEMYARKVLEKISRSPTLQTVVRWSILSRSELQNGVGAGVPPARRNAGVLSGMRCDDVVPPNGPVQRASARPGQ